MAKLALKTTSDPVADMLTRLRNAAAVNQEQVVLPYSKFKEQIAQILQAYRFISAVSMTKEAPKQLELSLKPGEKLKPITKIERVSKPGLRVYIAHQDIPTIKSGRGLTIVSTSVGLLPGHVAKQRGLGGELICKVW